MKKVLLLMYNTLDKGGIQSVMMNTVRQLHGEYIFDALVLKKKDGYFDSEFLSYGGRLFKEQFQISSKKQAGKLNFYLRGRFIYKKARNVLINYGPYDAIHCHIADEAGIVLKAAKDCGVPIRIAHAHTNFDRNYNIVAKLYTSLLKRMIFNNATDLVACSSGAGHSLFGDHPFQIIYNTVDKRFLDQTNRLDPHHSAPHLLQVGLVSSNKNQLFTVEVFHYLKKHYPQAKLTLIGSPKDAEMERYNASVHELVDQYYLTDSVRFLPANSDVMEEMKCSSYLLLPSLLEGLPVTLLEAQALGIKCFVSDSVTAEVDCGGCTYLSLDDGAEKWAECIAGQFEHDHGSREKFDMSRFTPEVIMDQYRKLYQGETSSVI